MVYFSSNSDYCLTDDDQGKRSLKENVNRNCPILNGRLNFVKFETRLVNDCLEFISSKQLHRYGMCLFVINATYIGHLQ